MPVEKKWDKIPPKSESKINQYSIKDLPKQIKEEELEKKVDNQPAYLYGIIQQLANDFVLEAGQSGRMDTDFECVYLVV